MSYKPFVIAFSGLKNSGKSTAVQVIKNSYNPEQIYTLSFAGPLKRAVSDIFCLDNECYDTVLKERVHPRWNVSARELLQKIGTELFRDNLDKECPSIKMPAETIWASSLYYKVKDIEVNNRNKNIKNSIVFIDDCRFDDEYDTIKKLGGVVIKILRTSNNTAETNLHRSEGGCKYDYELFNEGSLEDFTRNIKLFQTEIIDKQLIK